MFAVVAASWRCSSVTSQWLGHPDLSQCVSQRVANLTDAYTRFFDNVYVSTFLSTTTRRYFDHPLSGVVYISGPVCLSWTITFEHLDVWEVHIRTSGISSENTGQIRI